MALVESFHLRLVVADVDGTPLDQNGNVPDELWPLPGRLRACGYRWTRALNISTGLMADPLRTSPMAWPMSSNRLCR
jgi:hypothetical protein